MAGKIDVNTLRRNASAAAASASAERDRQQQEYFAGRRLAAEADTAVCAMLYAARAKDCVTGFPDRIDLASFNGYMTGYALEFRAGVWRVLLPEDYGQDVRIDGHLGSMPQHVARAMGIKHGPESSKSIKEALAWDLGQFQDELDAARKFLPEHTALALYGVGEPLFSMIGFANVRSAAREMALSAEKHGVTFTERPKGKGPTLLAKLANRRNAPFLGAAVELAGAKLDVECLHTAVYDNADDLARYIIGKGVSPAAQDINGFSVLHCAVPTMFMRFSLERGAETVRAMVEAGVPLDIVDCHGRTAETMFLDYRRDMQDEPEEHEVRILDEIENLLAG